MMQVDAFTPAPAFDLAIDREDKLLLAGALGAALALLVLAFVELAPAAPERGAVTASGSMRSAARGVTIDLDLVELLFQPASAAEEDPSPAIAAPPSAPAAGLPLDLLAQVEPAGDRRDIGATASTRPADDGDIVLQANAERREVRLALERLRGQSAVSAMPLAAALADALLGRADRAVAVLDRYGDALLLADSRETRQTAYVQFQVSRSAAVRDIEMARILLG